MKKMFSGNRGRCIGVLVVLVCISSMLAQSVRAQLQQQSITVSPPSIKLHLNPGETTEGKLSIINDSDGDLSFLTAVYDFIVTDNQGTPEILPRATIRNNKYSAANWIAVAPDSFTVKAHTRFDFKYFVQVPKDAGPGGHYAAIMYQPVEKGQQGGSGAHIQTQIASLAYITVSGPVNEYAKVTHFLAPSFQEYGPVQMQTEIKNFGDVHISPQGKITIKDMFGRTVASSVIKQRNIFPGNVALDYTNSIGSKFMIGSFMATFLGSYGLQNNLPLTAEVSFFVFPWRISLIIFLVIIAIVLGILLWRKKKMEISQVSSISSPDK